jgi:hypothetical protein
MEADADVAASFRHLKRRPREIEAVKFLAERPLADPDAAARKLIEIANAAEAVQDRRIAIELINGPFLNAGGTPAEFRAGIEHAISKGWLWRHESGVYVKFTPAGAELFV